MMQKVKLPQKVNPVRCALQRLDYIGIITPSRLVRLAELTAGVTEDAFVSLRFDKDAQGLTLITGTAEITVMLPCQRCNEIYTYNAKAEFIYTPLFERTQVEELPEDYDVIELDCMGEIDLWHLIEDELILALPLIPTHRREECAQGSASMSFGDIPVDEVVNPFAVLQKIKT